MSEKTQNSIDDPQHKAEGVWVEKHQRRFCLKGATFEYRLVARRHGLEWDATRKVWWSGKEEVVQEALAAIAKDQAERKAAPPPDLKGHEPILARVKHFGMEYWLIAERGEDRTLAALDGSMRFTVLRADTHVIRSYKARGGHENDVMTWARMRRLLAAAKERREAEDNIVLTGAQGPVRTYTRGRDPGTHIGDCDWVPARYEGFTNHIACVCTGYDSATYISADDWRDLGREKPGDWYTLVYWRKATMAEYVALQKIDPKASGVLP